MALTLAHIDHVFINFGNGTRQWVDIKLFGVADGSADDHTPLAALIAHDLFGDDYAGGEPGMDERRHGPYWRRRVTPECYDLTAAGTEDVRLRAWAERWAPLSEQLTTRLDLRLHQPLWRADRVYRLRDLDHTARHDWAGVHQQFHGLVMIHRGTARLHLAVAADD